MVNNKRIFFPPSFSELGVFLCVLIENTSIYYKCEYELILLIREWAFYIGGDHVSESKKRITLVDVVLERKGSMLFEGRKVKIPNDAANIIRDFIGDSDREKFVVLCLNVKNEPTAMQVVHTGSLNASIVHPRDVFKVAVLSNSASVVVAHNHQEIQQQVLRTFE